MLFPGTRIQNGRCLCPSRFNTPCVTEQLIDQACASMNRALVVHKTNNTADIDHEQNMLEGAVPIMHLALHRLK